MLRASSFRRPREKAFHPHLPPPVRPLLRQAFRFYCQARSGGYVIVGVYALYARTRWSGDLALYARSLTSFLSIPLLSLLSLLGR